MGSAKERPAFSFVSGRHHGPEVWTYVRRELEMKGWATIASEQPIDDPNVDLNEHAAIFNRHKEENGITESIDVAWSWGVNVTTRAVGQNAVRRLVHVGGVFDASTVANHPQSDEFSREHTINYDVLEQYINNLLAGGHTDEAVLADLRRTFYHDIKDEVLLGMIMGNLKPHPKKAEGEPVLEEFPDVPVSYIAIKDDKATPHITQVKNALALGVTPINIEGCHATMLDPSRAKKLADMLIDLAEGKDLSNRRLRRAAFAGHSQRSAGL